MTTEILQCDIAISDSRTVTVRMIEPIELARVTALVQAASALLPGVTAHPAVIDFRASDHPNRYGFAIKGELEYPEDQTREVMENALRVLAQEFEKEGFVVSGSGGLV